MSEAAPGLRGLLVVAVVAVAVAVAVAVLVVVVGGTGGGGGVVWGLWLLWALLFMRCEAVRDGSGGR